MVRKGNIFHSPDQYRFFTFVGGIILVMVFIGYVLFTRHARFPANQAADSLVVEVKPMQVDSGWGYQIWVNQHPFIYQNQIPAIPGHHLFRSREEALRVGEWVANRIRQHQSPTITQANLQQLGITIPAP
ncbi:MAG: DUF4907 domain-containing protein [Thermoflavifilum sp.]|nr:DUF4907 domain-containing protein [Thermoflavifilum sp.]